MFLTELGLKVMSSSSKSTGEGRKEGGKGGGGKRGGGGNPCLGQLLISPALSTLRPVSAAHELLSWPL